MGIIRKIALLLLLTSSIPATYANNLSMPDKSKPLFNCEYQYKAFLEWSLAPPNADFSFINHRMRIKLSFPPAQLNRKSYVLDTNIILAILMHKETPGGLPLTNNNRKLIQATANRFGISEEELLSLAFEKERVWITQETVSELATGNHPNLVANFSAHIIPPSPDKNTIEYVFTRYKLEQLNLGRRDGVADQKIVTQLFHSPTADGSVPRFVTADKGIYNALCKISPECKGPDIGGKPVWQRFPDGFQARLVDSSGLVRKIHVIPVNANSVASAPEAVHSLTPSMLDPVLPTRH